jgi:hypothetical protein
VTPVSTTDLQGVSGWFSQHQRCDCTARPFPAAVGKLGVESRSDTSSGEHYVLVSVRGDAGVAQARLFEAEWKSNTSVGRLEDLG